MRYVFIHGLGQTSAVWNKTIENLNMKSDCICLDLPVMMNSKQINYPNLYKAFSAYCDKLSKPFNLCGLSLGGILALNYAVEHPEAVNAMVLIGTQYKMPAALLKFQNILFRFMPQFMFKQMAFGKKDFIALSKSMMALDFSKDLAQLSCPTLIVCGEKDRANQKAANDLKGFLPHSEIQIIENAGHEVNVDAPEQLAKLLNVFYVDLII